MTGVGPIVAKPTETQATAFLVSPNQEMMAKSARGRFKHLFARRLPPLFQMTETINADYADPTALLLRLGLALGLGLLIGLQRQRTKARLAGIRTFPLVTILGAACGVLAKMHGGWVLAGGFVAVAMVIVAAMRITHG
jgi:hypothetical protein